MISGPGGVGKTALAVRWAENARDFFPDGQLHVDLNGFGAGDPVDPGEALGELLRALGTPPERMPVTLAERCSLYRSMTADRTLLVLLDSAHSAAQVRALLPAGCSKVLVTSRARLVGLVADGARLVDLAPLRPAESILLLSRAAGRDLIDHEPDEAARLAEICGGLPIALCVAAARLAARPRLSVRRMTRDLASEAHRIGQLSRVDGLSVQATFDVSYRSLPAEAAAVYRRLALHPGSEFGIGVVAAVLPAPAADDGGAERSADPSTGPGGSDRPPAGRSDESADRDEYGTPAATDLVETLLEASLLEEIGENRFRYHDLLRLHARQKVETDETESARGLVVCAVLEWYFAAAARADLVLTPYRRRLPYDFVSRPGDLPRFPDREAALTWLDRERLNLFAAGREALRRGHAKLAWQLSDVVWPLLLYRKHYVDRLRVDRCGVESARACGDRWAEAEMLKRLGRVLTKFGDHQGAERHTTDAILRYQQAGDVRGRLDAEAGLAALYRESGRAAEAVELFGRLVGANRELGDDRNTGLALINLGTLLAELGRPGEAIGFLREAEGIFAGLTTVDPYNGARVLIALAGALLSTGDLTGAERAATEAARRMRGLGSDHEYAEALGQLGRVVRRQGDSAAARRHFQRAREIFVRLGSSRAVEVDRYLAELGRSPGGGGPTSPAGPAGGPGVQPEPGDRSQPPSG
ncbi:tetratricopeptide repeat protein [Plantactinospora sp. KLBMP9567]|uniref:tetratricopeptide repeat protein n=1 Tax=Plantactinospora sp. KLBMP9567 TaxID=3085900 RepID=UPI00298132B8|nr:tetratricopeptide repeat protein [Plantactinospora sp. KLBMP9567]MDW5330516.1 tetratricopeptide repeat protein [Plantactinospora sp. KLBMP9567]